MGSAPFRKRASVQSRETPGTPGANRHDPKTDNASRASIPPRSDAPDTHIGRASTPCTSPQCRPARGPCPTRPRPTDTPDRESIGHRQTDAPSTSPGIPCAHDAKIPRHTRPVPHVWLSPRPLSCEVYRVPAPRQQNLFPAVSRHAGAVKLVAQREPDAPAVSRHQLFSC